MSENSKMKRQDFTIIIAVGFIAAQFPGCSFLGFRFGNPNVKQEQVPPPPKTTGETSTRRTSRRNRGSSGITDLKTLSQLLQQARRPLSDMQIEYLLTLKTGPEFSQKMMDILTDSQKEALKNASRVRRRRRR